MLRRGCPKCARSKGELRIESILRASGIDFQKEYCFNDLISPLGGYLRFDFAILKNNALQYLIEYDGVQSFTEAQWWRRKI